MKFSKLMGTMPWQFRGKPALSVFCSAFQKEAEELQRMFEELERKRSFEGAEGKQLDGIGDIVVLTRADAGVLAAKGKQRITFPVLDDERYRRLLRYKVLKNTSVSTYEDVTAAIKMIYQREPITVVENRDGPATMRVSFPLYENGESDPFDEVPPIKAAGVGIKIYGEEERENHGKLQIAAGLVVTEWTAIVPPQRDDRFRQTVYLASACMTTERYQVPPDSTDRHSSGAVFCGAGVWQEIRMKVGRMYAI